MRVILVGGGQAVFFLARTFLGKGHAVTIIDRDAEECARLAGRIDATIVHGDGSNPGILEEAGARAADVVLAATSSDPDNLIACQVARSRFHVPRAVALVNDPENQTVFQQLGIDALSTALTVASLIEQQAALDSVTQLIPAAGGRVTLSEITLRDTFPAVGRSIVHLGLPRDALVAVLMRDGETIIPRGDTELKPEDRVLLVALEESRDRALQVLTGSHA